MVHEPNLCVIQQRCDLCITDENLFFCQTCGYRQTIFKSESIPQFMKYLANIRNKFKQFVVLAHNAQAFDGQFILKYFLEHSHKPELIIYNAWF